MNNRQKLIDLLTEHNLDRRDVAAMLSVKPATVDHWLLSAESKNHEEIPQMAIELLELKLKFKRQADRLS
jgi:transposase